MASCTTASCKWVTLNMQYKCILTFFSTLFILTGILASGNNFPPERENELYGRIIPSSTFQISPIGEASFSQMARNEPHGKEENPVVKKRRLDGNSIGSSNKFNTNLTFGLEDERTAFNYCDGDPSHSQEPSLFVESPMNGTKLFGSGLSQNHVQDYQAPIHYFTQTGSQNAYPTFKTVNYPPNHFNQVNLFGGQFRFYRQRSNLVTCLRLRNIASKIFSCVQSSTRQTWRVEISVGKIGILS